MVAIPSRHKSAALLTAVLLAQVLLLAVQIKRDARGRLVRVWAISAATPFEKSGAWGFGRIAGVWHHYFALQNTSRENEALRVENDALKLTITELHSKASEADRLAALMDFREAHKSVPMVGARVIGASPVEASRTIEIDRGERDGIQRNMPVITPDGAVGKVIETYRDTAQILLLSDRESGAGAMLVQTRNQKPIAGTGEPMLTLKYVPADDVVNVGDKVVTNGMDKIFPPDIPVGTVIDVKPGNPFKTVRVRPAAKLDRLEDVIVLLKPSVAVEFPKEAEATSSNGTAPASAPGDPKPSTSDPAAAVKKP
ncbi:MAG TPA: rod shape-determining protein MreC [Candidatus Acidoferrum sp.]|jgi:rod shape-determining protein MreC